ncbi:MAG: hypothetical protein U0Y10_14470 [Spirosomataceae bacterium]
MPHQRWQKGWLLGWLFFMVVNAWGQQVAKDTLRKATSQERDSTFYTNLKNKMNKSSVGREIYNFLFRDVYNSNASRQVQTIEVNPFLEHEGKVIRHIVIRRFDVFGPSVYDTLRKPSNWVERFGNKLHKETQESVIKNSFLLFEEGEVLRPQTLWDNERLLRQASIFHDARILVVPDKRFANLVDVYVITHDVWSLNPNIDIGGTNKFGLELEQKNFRGLAHTFTNTIRYNGSAPSHPWEFGSLYRIPYIKRTFITAEAQLQLYRDFKIVSAKAYRPFITPETKYAGAAELSYNRITNYVYDLGDSVRYESFPLNYFYGDIWLGRAFKLDLGSKLLNERARLVIAARTNRYIFTERPQVSLDSNRLYENRSTYLFSVGFSNRQYRRDVLIYGFGRTEDVPYGYLGSIVFGHEKAEFGGRDYFGFKFAQGRYLPKNWGYLYTLANFGYYNRGGDIEQGVLSLEANYFSGLLKLRRANLRQFINLRYTTGINRFNFEYIGISGADGIRGANSSKLLGTKRLTLNLETVLFSSFQVVGFRIASYAFADLGLVETSNQSLLSSPIYQGFGLGFRFRNENLTFNTFSVRFAFYPNIFSTSQLGFDLGGETPLRLRDFTIEQPEIVPFR